MKNFTLKNILFLLVYFVLLGACSNPKKLVEKKKYDKVIEILVRKFAKKATRPVEDVQNLETALREANLKNLKLITALKKISTPDWARINNTYKRIQYRQKLVERIIPVIDDNGREVNLEFIDVNAAEQESKEKAAGIHYKKAQAFLNAAVQNEDRFKARQAHQEFTAGVGKYFSNLDYLESASLNEQAKALSYTHILLKISSTNSSGSQNVMLPSNFHENFFADFQDTAWIKLHREDNNQQKFHYEFALMINKNTFGQEKTTSRQYTDSKEIQDGTIEVQDSNGNTVTQANMITVSANVTEITQSKDVTVNANIQIFGKNPYKVLYTESILGQGDFNNIFATFQGDNRSLSPISQTKINNSPLSFPNNIDLVNKAANQMSKPAKRILIKKYGTIIL